MVTVQRANVILDIKECEVDRYLNNGFNVIDERGNVLQSAKPVTIEQFQQAYMEQRRMNDVLLNENAKLKQEIESLKQAQKVVPEKPVKPSVSDVETKAVTKKSRAKKAE